MKLTSIALLHHAPDHYCELIIVVNLHLLLLLLLLILFQHGDNIDIYTTVCFFPK